jgi:hypothetical protein
MQLIPAKKDWMNVPFFHQFTLIFFAQVDLISTNWSKGKVRIESSGEGEAVRGN